VEARRQLRECRARVEALSAEMRRDAPMREALAQAQELIGAVLLPTPAAGSAAAAAAAANTRALDAAGLGGRDTLYSSPTSAACDALLESRRALKLAAIAKYMVQRPLARIKIDRGPLNDLGAIVSRLQLLVELLDALLDIRMAEQLDDESERRYEEPESPGSGAQSPLGGAAVPRQVSGERAVALLKHAALLCSTDTRVGYASLTALTRVTRATLHELGLCLLRLVQPRSAAAGEAQGAGVVGTLVESGIAGMVSTFSNLFGSSAQM